MALHSETRFGEGRKATLMGVTGLRRAVRRLHDAEEMDRHNN
jgi:hypothetical protein